MYYSLLAQYSTFPSSLHVVSSRFISAVFTIHHAFEMPDTLVPFLTGLCSTRAKRHVLQAVSCATLTREATPRYSSNITSTALGSSVTPVCCFVVQDTVSKEWFEETSTSITHSIVNLTSITTFITVYPNTTKTAYETHVTTTNASFTFSSLVGVNPITDYTNDAPGPTESMNAHYNGTAVVTAGIIM